MREREKEREIVRERERQTQGDRETWGQRDREDGRQVCMPMWPHMAHEPDSVCSPTSFVALCLLVFVGHRHGTDSAGGAAAA